MISSFNKYQRNNDNNKITYFDQKYYSNMKKKIQKSKDKLVFINIKNNYLLLIHINEFEHF